LASLTGKRVETPIFVFAGFTVTPVALRHFFRDANGWCDCSALVVNRWRRALGGDFCFGRIPICGLDPIETVVWA
jgi:hypothetical protein